MSAALLEAFDLVAYSEQLLLRLRAAATELEKREGLAEEKAWLALAVARVAEARDGVGALLTRALRIPELEPLKGDHARLLQGAVVDALERVHAAITVAGGPRAPLLEALSYRLKIPALRKCEREEFERFCGEFEKRLRSSFARRMLADPDYAVVGPTLDGLAAEVATWRSVYASEPLPAEEAAPLCEELFLRASRLEVPCRQARLLAQAALAPLRLLDDHGVGARPKRRAPRVLGELDEDSHALLEHDPPDPAAPTPEELAELEAARATAT